MSLTSALRIATGSLAGNSQHVSLLSKNIAGINNPNYVRREALVTTGIGGNVNFDVKRYVNEAMMRATISSTSSAEYQGVLSTSLDRLSALVNVDDFSGSPTALLGDLEEALQLAASAPSDVGTLTSVVETAINTATAINSAYQQTLDMKGEADSSIAGSVTNINNILSQIKTANDQIVAGTQAGLDVNDAMDNRDALISQLSSEIGISVKPGANNDIVITTEGGVVLFEQQPRQLEYVRTPVYGPSTVGGELRIDGVTVTGAGSPMPITNGKLSGYFEMRDNILTEHQNQLDEFSRGLVELFAETDQTGGGKPPLAGLFTWSGGPGIPTTGTLTAGIAQSLSINPLVDTAQGGDLGLLRDGGINGDADYIVNTAGSVGYSDHLNDLAAKFDATASFDALAGLQTSSSLRTFASSSLDWLQTQRQTSASAFEYQSALQENYSTSLQSEMGPNLDDEMSKLLEAERAYQATAKVISTVDELFRELLNIVR